MGLDVFERQAGLPGKDLYGGGAKSESVVVCEQDIGPAGAFEDSVGTATLAFDLPADLEKRSQSLWRLEGGPVL